jgi:hypothetical protein
MALGKSIGPKKRRRDLTLVEINNETSEGVLQLTYVPHDTILLQGVYYLDTFRRLDHSRSKYMLEEWERVSCSPDCDRY